MFLLAAAVVVLLAAAFALASLRAIARAGRAEAPTVARHRFLAAFDARGAAFGRPPADLLVQTYETLARRLDDGVPHADLRPAARLGADLGLTRADVEDVALLVAARCEGRLPRGRDLDALHHEVTTVEHLVDFLAPFVQPVAPARAA
jgi:type II secretory pathway pseudopilin PulG